MKSLVIIDLLNEIGKPFHHVPYRFIFTQVHLLVFKRFEKALHLGIIIGITFPRHTDGKAATLEVIYVFHWGVLHALVGVVNDAWIGTSPHRRLGLQRSQGPAMVPRKVKVSCRRDHSPPR